MIKFKVKGYISQFGEKFIEITQDGTDSVLVPRDLFSENNAEKRRYLWSRGVKVATDQALSSLLKEINKIDGWKKASVASQAGWNGPGLFVCLDGSIDAGPDQTRYLNAFDKGRRSQRAGTSKGWKKQVAGQISGQHLPIFAVAFSFLPPLLDLVTRNMNVGFNFFGPAASGKTTLQQLAASVWGPPTRNASFPYMVTSHTTLNGLEDTMREHCDHPVIMDEMALFSSGSSGKKKASDLQAFAYKLASGQAKTRHGDPANAKPYHFAILLSANDPLSYFLDGGETDTAARQRILDIPIFEDRPHLIFDRIPKKYANGADFAQSLIAGAEQHHGRAGPKFVKRLVAARAADEEILRSRIKKLIDEFLDTVVDGHIKGHDTRVGGAFGLVYAAAVLAQEYRSLPQKLDVLAAVQQCYKLHRAHETEFPPFAERLEALRKDKATLRWKSGIPNKISKAGVIYYEAGKLPEIWIRPNAIEEVFPDWWAIRESPEVEAHLLKDGEHYTTKRQAGKKLKSVRIHVFRLMSA